ncbi:MAG TPA: alpha/beta hydrolase-fold protein [Polyangiaceae bacterium]
MRRVVGRRALVTGVAAAAALACSRSERAAGKPPPVTSIASPNVHVLTWDLGPKAFGDARAVVVVPAWGAPDARFPVVVALHGRGESVKTPAEGAMGWPRDYAMVRAIDRLRAPPLRDSDYEGFVTPARLAETNASLAARPFGGVIVVCPWLPDVRPASTGDIQVLARYVLGDLLPKVRAETPALASPEATGIDGVSLGGMLALRIGLSSPDAFGAVGGIQAAFDGGQNAEWTALAQAARARRPGMKLRLLTSHDDYFHDPIVAVSAAWKKAGIEHDFADVPGPHDYIFNRGPGSIELLLWHDRNLARA